MTVKELIEHLQTMDGDLEVKTSDGYNFIFLYTQNGDVILNTEFEKPFAEIIAHSINDEE